jgi:monomeric sarcosine oxidase
LAYDVIVVGGGVMGSATARALARRGRSVALLEQFVVKHKRGSSHGSARIFRMSYPDPRYVRMAMESIPMWRELEAEYGRPLLATTGGFDRGQALGDHVDALKICGVPYEVVEGTEVGRRWAAPSFPASDVVLYQPDAGVIAAEEAWTAFVQGADRHGAVYREGARVTEISPGQRNVVVWMGDRELETRAVVVTAGAWAKPLLRDAGINLNVRPTRETVAYFDVPEPMPLLVEWGEPSIYALPSGERTMKVGEHIAGPITNPDEEGVINDASIARLRDWVGVRYPGAASSPAYAETCLYTNTPDEHFVLERHGRVVVGSPCSGHGFKFAPYTGEVLANLADEALGM